MSVLLRFVCSAIGGNVWLTRSVPPGSVITQANEKDGMPS